VVNRAKTVAGESEEMGG